MRWFHSCVKAATSAFKATFQSLPDGFTRGLWCKPPGCSSRQVAGCQSLPPDVCIAATASSSSQLSSTCKAAYAFSHTPALRGLGRLGSIQGLSSIMPHGMVASPQQHRLFLSFLESHCHARPLVCGCFEVSELLRLQNWRMVGRQGFK